MSEKFNFEPEHLKGVYAEVHKEIKEERKLYPKKTPENTSMKLAGNGSYGKGGSEFSPLCDKQYVVQTCVNGQLLLCMLAETLTIELSFYEMLQINTDGLTMRIKKKDLELFRLICKRWESLTSLILEEAFYSKMVISNVNNYLAIYDYGGVKRKGTYEYELELCKNFSMLVIPKALEAYFVHGIDVQTFIYNHTDLYDFFKRTKVNKTDRLLTVVYDEDGNVVSDNEIQRITRYLISGEVVYTKETKKYHNVGQGISLIKEMPPIEPKDSKKLRDAYSFATIEQGYEGSFEEFKQLVKKIRHNNYEAGFLCTVVNQMITDEEIKKIIYYPYYIAEVYKIINVIERNNGI